MPVVLAARVARGNVFRARGTERIAPLSSSSQRAIRDGVAAIANSMCR